MVKYKHTNRKKCEDKKCLHCCYVCHERQISGYHNDNCRILKYSGFSEFITYPKCSKLPKGYSPNQRRAFKLHLKECTDIVDAFYDRQVLNLRSIIEKVRV